MSDHAEMSMFVYQGLRSHHERALKSMEDVLFQVLLRNGVTGRPWWVYNESAGNDVVQLVLPGAPEPTILVELAPDEISNATATDVATRLADALE